MPGKAAENGYHDLQGFSGATVQVDAEGGAGEDVAGRSEAVRDAAMGGEGSSRGPGERDTEEAELGRGRWGSRQPLDPENHGLSGQRTHRQWYGTGYPCRAKGELSTPGVVTP
ncbi:hypothetical protein AAFF_G00368390 [Aldrovandia affinis]|uniref:Uncharacterized protein n=1 Tax=Aldrovandia affinis TaxID=143900 RepID=A0AAD7SGY5_9TELE|nr:hypothetical protein AAFF_G00368390 [Aldrovandia affinis]